MNNILLDVAIGLIFMYLLYSLLATTIKELIATIFAYRHRMLEKAIEQMLDGKSYSYFWWNKLFNIFWWIYYYLRNLVKGSQPETNMALRPGSFFHSQPLNAGEVNSKEGKIKIRRSKLNKKADLFAANVANHPLYRRKAEGSLLYNKPAYLSASAFSDILLDILSGKEKDSIPSPVLMKDVTSFVKDNKQVNTDLKKIINIFIEQANGDVQKFKLLIEDWFDDTMNRVSGWYKRQASKILLIIGIVLAVTFNINSIEIAGKLSASRDLREMMVQSATNYVRTNPKNSINNSADTSLADAKTKIREIQSLYNDTLSKVNMMMGLGWDFPIKKMTKKYYLVPDYATGPFNKVIFILGKTIESPRKWIGFLITALAISLGAPFWFDLLNKLVNIRSGGNKPSDDDATKSVVSKTATLNQTPNLRAKG